MVGNQRTRKTLNLTERQAIARLYQDGKMTLEEIARRFGCKKSTVSVIGHQAGHSRKQPYSEQEVELIMRSKELGFEKVASMITENGHQTDFETVQTLYYYYRKNKN